TRARQRSSKMCSGSTKPGKSTVPKGNSGSVPVTRTRLLSQCLGDRQASRPGRTTLIRVLSRLDLRSSGVDPRKLMPRAQFDVSPAVEKIRPVVEAVKTQGISGVLEATQRFDGVTLTHCRVPAEAFDQELDPQVRDALEEAIARVRKVHADQRRNEATTQVVPGGTVTERWIPVRRVGLYVPGGLAMYPSTVVMNVVPAQLAGVEELVVGSPPQRETGLPDARVLAVCKMLGVTEVYAVGGAQAVAMLAYGTEECAPVDLITGPGNIWVTAAKRL